MKKILLLISMLLVYSSVMAQGLESEANYIKENFPDDYAKTIRKYAMKEWGDDYTMVVYEINKQSKALADLVNKFESDNTNIAFRAIQEWSIDEYKNENIKLFQTLKVFDIKSLIKMHCDWSMVEYEYDKQVKAKSQF